MGGRRHEIDLFTANTQELRETLRPHIIAGRRAQPKSPRAPEARSSTGGNPYPFEIKVEVARRFLAGESKTALAQEFDLSSPLLVSVWARIFREKGEDGLKPKRRGRPSAAAESADEVLALRREVERLRAENAYLGKLQALMEQQRRSR